MYFLTRKREIAKKIFLYIVYIHLYVQFNVSNNSDVGAPVPNLERE